MENGRVAFAKAIAFVDMLLGDLPIMSLADIEWLISLPEIRDKIGKLIDSSLPEEGPGYAIECDGSMTGEDLLLKGNITFEGGTLIDLSGITPHSREQIIVRLLRRDESSPVSLALAEHMIQSRGSIGACNFEEMLSWIVRSWHNYLKLLKHDIVFPNPGGGLHVSVRLHADEKDNPALEVEINRKEWHPGTYFAVVVYRDSVSLA